MNKRQLITRESPQAMRDYPHDCLADVEIFTAERTARAETRLLLTEWSNFYVHSADLMLPMIQLAERLAGEKVQAVKSMKFLQPVQTELELTASLAQSPNEKGTAVIASFTTTNRQQVQVRATPIEKAIRGGTWSARIGFINSIFTHHFANDTVTYEGIRDARGKPVSVVGTSIQLKPGTIPAAKNSLELATLLDIGLATIRQVHTHGISVVSRIDDLALTGFPPLPEADIACVVPVPMLPRKGKNCTHQPYDTFVINPMGRMIGSARIFMTNHYDTTDATTYMQTLRNSRWTTIKN